MTGWIAMAVAAVCALLRRTDIHYPKPGALGITQATEVGTVYSVAEVQKLTDQYIGKIDAHLASKEKEILTV